MRGGGMIEQVVVPERQAEHETWKSQYSPVYVIDFSCEIGVPKDRFNIQGTTIA